MSLSAVLEISIITIIFNYLALNRSLFYANQFLNIIIDDPSLGFKGPLGTETEWCLKERCPLSEQTEPKISSIGSP